MDNVLIVVDDLEAVKSFFIELGLAFEGETTVEGPAVARLLGLENVRQSSQRCERQPINPSDDRRLRSRRAVVDGAAAQGLHDRVAQ
jgi:hypothetical protein